MKKKITPFKNKVWLSSPTMHGEELKYMTEAYETNWMSTVGANINEVEKQISEKLGCRYAVALANGTMGNTTGNPASVAGTGVTNPGSISLYK